MNFNPNNSLKNFVEGTKSRALQNKVVALAKKGLMLIKALINFIIGLVQFLATMFFSPIGWIIIGGFILTLMFFSGIQTWGPQTFNVNLQSKNGLNLESIEPEKQNEAVSLYLANQGISPEVSAYIAKKAKEGNFSAISGATNCNTECLLSKINNGEIDKNNITLGAFNLKGDNAIELLQKAQSTGKEWTDKSLQINLISEKIINESKTDKSELSSSGKILEGVNKVNEIIGLPKVDGQAGLELTRELQSSAKSFKKKISKVKALGAGTGKGRVDGGGARDTTKAAGFVDASELVAFMESFAVADKISTKGSDGSGSATPEMIEAKRLAQEKGGADPAPNLYSSCDRFVATSLKATGIDIDFPWGDVDIQHNYVLAHPEKWQKVDASERQSGDVIFWLNGGNDWGHIAIYGVTEDGTQKIYQASYYDYLPLKTVTNDKNPDPNWSGKVFEYWRFIGSKP